jgi:hypothetical protein
LNQINDFGVFAKNFVFYVTKAHLKNQSAPRETPNQATHSSKQPTNTQTNRTHNGKSPSIRINNWIASNRGFAFLYFYNKEDNGSAWDLE